MLIKNRELTSSERTLKRQDVAGNESTASFIASQAPAVVENRYIQKDAPELELDTEQDREKELAALKAEVKRQAIEEARVEIDNEIAKVRKEYELFQAEHSAKVNDSIKKLENALVAAREYETSLLESSEASIVKIVMECVYKLTRERDTYKGIVERTVSQVIYENQSDEKLKIRCSELDKNIAELVGTQDSSLCQIIVDPNLNAGDFFVESGYSTNDMSVMTQLDQLREALVSTLRRRENDREI